MKPVVASVEGEYRRYKKLAEDAIAQLSDAQLGESEGNSNSIATIMWHVGGNLASRFTDFLTADGEKPWRDRDSEFLPRQGVKRAETLAVWDKGWKALFAATEALSDADLSRTVAIRTQPMNVAEALHRSLSHVSYHVGQIVFVAKAIKGGEWKWLTIPPGMSAHAMQHPEAYKSKAPSK